MHACIIMQCSSICPSSGIGACDEDDGADVVAGGPDMRNSYIKFIKYFCFRAFWALSAVCAWAAAGDSSTVALDAALPVFCVCQLFVPRIDPHNQAQATKSPACQLRQCGDQRLTGLLCGALEATVTTSLCSPPASSQRSGARPLGKPARWHRAPHVRNVRHRDRATRFSCASRLVLKYCLDVQQ